MGGKIHFELELPHNMIALQFNISRFKVQIPHFGYHITLILLHKLQFVGDSSSFLELNLFFEMIISFNTFKATLTQVFNELISIVWSRKHKGNMDWISGSYHNLHIGKCTLVSHVIALDWSHRIFPSAFLNLFRFWDDCPHLPHMEVVISP